MVQGTHNVSVLPVICRLGGCPGLLFWLEFLGIVLVKASVVLLMRCSGLYGAALNAVGIWGGDVFLMLLTENSAPRPAEVKKGQLLKLPSCLMDSSHKSNFT